MTISGAELYGEDDEPGVWSLSRWRAEVSQGWRSEAAISTSPTHAVWLGEGKLRLWKFPDATARALTAYISGWYRPKKFDWESHQANELADMGLPECAQMAALFVGAAWSAGVLAGSEGAWAKAQYLAGESGQLSSYMGAMRECERIGIANSRAFERVCSYPRYTDWI